MMSEANKQSLLAESDKCVMCGMCLPHCPTYIHARNENESPRGRLVLGKAVLNGDIKLDDHVRQHFDNCLLCRSCERICPSDVRFGSFMDGLRSTLYQSTEHATTSLDDILLNPERAKKTNRLLGIMQKTGLQHIAKPLLGGKNRRLLAALPHISPRHDLLTSYPVRNAQHRVMLFTGCTSNVFGTHLLEATIELLNRLEVHVDVPAAQTCCGGLARHKGDWPQAETLANQNLAAFADIHADPIVGVISGCMASLRDYPGLDNDPASKDFARRVCDISTFILSLDWPDNIRLRPLHKRVAIHTPCSLRNGLRQEAAVIRLLQKIPELELVSLPDNQPCCGAAGNYMFEPEHAILSDSLREKSSVALQTLQAELVVTSNIGCAMQLQQDLQTNIMHPVELLLAQIM